MPVRRRGNKLERWEIALIKAMVADGRWPIDQDILAYFTRPTRSINHRAIAEIRDNTKHTAIKATSPDHDTILPVASALAIDPSVADDEASPLQLPLGRIDRARRQAQGFSEATGLRPDRTDAARQVVTIHGLEQIVSHQRHRCRRQPEARPRYLLEQTQQIESPNSPWQSSMGKCCAHDAAPPPTALASESLER